MATLQNTTFTTSSTTVNVTVPTTGTGLAFDKAGYFTATALTSGTSVSWDAGSNQSAVLVLGHNATIANATNHANGGVYILKVTQNTAPKTLSWATGYKWPGNTAPTMTATAGAVDVFTFV